MRTVHLRTERARPPVSPLVSLLQPANREGLNWTGVLLVPTHVAAVGSVTRMEIATEGILARQCKGKLVLRYSSRMGRLPNTVFSKGNVLFIIAKETVINREVSA